MGELVEFLGELWAMSMPYVVILFLTLVGLLVFIIGGAWLIKFIVWAVPS